MSYVVSNLPVVTDLLSYICPVVTLPYWEMLRIRLQSMLVLLVVSTHSISVWVSPSYNKLDTTLYDIKTLKRCSCVLELLSLEYGMLCSEMRRSLTVANL